MHKTTLHLDTNFQIDSVDPRIFGGFLEHMGRAVYEGVYQPDSAHADANGFRTDVLTAMQPIAWTNMRYPGGNFASGYHWEDGVGPRDERPTVRELAWQSIETNQVGTDEFMILCRQMNWEPMLTVNLGTGTPEEARNWVEYCNAPAGTKYADMRVANGHPEPYGIKMWCLGNEMDGPWQLGHVPADQYAIRAQQAAKMMRDVDPTIELIACGSCAPNLPTYLDWDRQVLDYVGDYADYISLHRYAQKADGEDSADFLAITNSIDDQIEATAALCRFTQSRRRSDKRTMLCFDEWNVWYRTMSPEFMDGRGKVAPHLIEEVYSLEDALVVAGFLNSFIRHADVLKIANIAQIVNIIAPLLTRDDDLLVQSIYYPLAMYAKRKEGVALRAKVAGPTYQSQAYGEATVIDSSAILNGDALNVFLTNRSAEIATVTINIADRQVAHLANAELLTADHPDAKNTWETPGVVKAVGFDSAEIKNGSATVTLPPYSLVAMTLNLT